MKNIPLSQGKFALVDDEDFEQLNKHKWFATKNHSGIWYARRNTNRTIGKRKIILMHRKIMNCSSDMKIDHANHDGLDNRRCNIRICTNSQNRKNSGLQKNNSSGLIGVSWHKRCKKWMARIQKDKRDIHIGYFNNKVEAGHMVDQFSICLFGEFAVLNFPDDVKVEK